MQSPWKRLNLTEPDFGSEELSIGLAWLMSLRHNSENKQGARGAVGEGVRWEEWGWMTLWSFGSKEVPAGG